MSSPPPDPPSRTLAAEVEAGTYVPTQLDACDASLTLERLPEVIRFAEFILFTEAAARSASPRYAILQPHLLQESRRRRNARDRRRRSVDAFVAEWEAELPTASLPASTQGLDVIRASLRGLADRGQGRSHSTALAGAPDLDLPEAVFRKRYAAWRAKAKERAIREYLESFATAVGTAPRFLHPNASTASAIADALMELVFPGPFQPYDGIYLPVALCVSFEQEWRLWGYTRGELLTSLSLAPGEQLNLEVHSWDKSTRRTEQELATESEIRSSEKLTQRDALTVAQEYAQQNNTKVDASGVIPIPDLPIKLGVTATTDVRNGMKRTTDSLRDRTVEASNTLKANRKARIEISRDVGREEKQTRVVENTNRCHTLLPLFRGDVGLHGNDAPSRGGTVCVAPQPPREVYRRVDLVSRGDTDPIAP